MNLLEVNLSLIWDILHRIGHADKCRSARPRLDRTAPQDVNALVQALSWIRPRSTPMRKIIVGAQVSIDGVMQAPGGPTEDPTKGFRFGGWSIPYFDQDFGEEVGRLFKDSDLLLGRKTYEIFAGYWP